MYQFMKVLHLLGVIIGFGTVFLNGLYGKAMSEKRGAEAAFMGHTVERVGKVAEYFIYSVFITGFATLGLSEDVFEFGQTWVWLSVLLYIVGIGISHGMLMPNTKRMNALMDELAAGPPPGAGGPPPQAVELEERGKRQAMISMVLNLLLVVIVALMVAKPGFP